MREIKFRAWDGYDIIYNLSIVRNLFINSVFENEFYDFMQYTGLKDKNGVEIYEGDIVSQTYENYTPNIIQNKKIEYSEFGSFIAVHEDDFNYTNLDEHEEFEVIGNIYKDKELLSYKGGN